MSWDGIGKTKSRKGSVTDYELVRKWNGKTFSWKRTSRETKNCLD